MTTIACKASSVVRHAQGLRLTPLIPVALFAIVAIPAPAHAGSRGIGLSIGGGLLLLNELSKNGQRRAHRQSENDGGSRKLHTSRSRHHDEDDDPPAKVAKHRKHNDDNDDDGDSKKKAAERDDDSKSDGNKNNGNGDEDVKVKAAQPVGAVGKNAAVAEPEDKLSNAGAGATKSEQIVIKSEAEVRSAQEHLKFLGYDLNATDGAIDAKTTAAFKKYQKSINAPETGALTVEQLRTLFAKVAATINTSPAPNSGK